MSNSPELVVIIDEEDIEVNTVDKDGLFELKNGFKVGVMLAGDDEPHILPGDYYFLEDADNVLLIHQSEMQEVVSVIFDFSHQYPSHYFFMPFVMHDNGMVGVNFIPCENSQNLEVTMNSGSLVGEDFYFIVVKSGMIHYSSDDFFEPGHPRHGFPSQFKPQRLQ